MGPRDCVTSPRQMTVVTVSPLTLAQGPIPFKNPPFSNSSYHFDFTEKQTVHQVL